MKDLIVFTDGCGKTGKAIVTRKDDNGWQTVEGHDSGSPQLVELCEEGATESQPSNNNYTDTVTCHSPFIA